MTQLRTLPNIDVNTITTCSGGFSILADLLKNLEEIAAETDFDNLDHCTQVTQDLDKLRMIFSRIERIVHNDE